MNSILKNNLFKFLSAGFTLLIFVFGSGASADKLGQKQRMEKRKAEQKQSEEEAIKEMRRDKLRVDYKAQSTRTVDVKVTDQKYHSGVMKSERDEIKLTKEDIREEDELIRAKKVEAELARETAKNDYEFEKKKKRDSINR